MIRPSSLIGRNILESRLKYLSIIYCFLSTYILLDVIIQSFVLFYFIERSVKFWEAQDKYSLNI